MSKEMENIEKGVKGEIDAAIEMGQRSALGDVATRQRISQLENDRGSYTPISGVSARENLALFDKRMREVDEFASKLFGGDTDRMNRYRSDIAVSRAKTRGHLKSLVDTETRHAAVVANKESIDREVSTICYNDILELSAKTQEQGMAFEELSEKYNSAISAADGNVEEAIRQVAINDKLSPNEKKDMEAGIRAAGLYMKTRKSMENDGALAEVNSRSMITALGQVEPLKKKISELFERNFRFLVGSGKDSATAYDISREAMRNATLGYFKGRISKGQSAEAMAMMKAIEAQSDEAFKESKVAVDADGKPVLDENGNKQYTGEGKFDPSRMLFCRHEDFKTLCDAAHTALRQVEERQLTVTANRQRVLGLHAEKVKDMAYKFGQGIDPYTGQPFDTSDMNAFSEIENKLNSEVSMLEKSGYLKTRQLYSAIRNEPRKERVMRERMNRLAQKSAAKQLVAEKESDIEAKITELENKPNATYTEEIELEDDNGKMKKVTVTLDADRGICALIDEARSLGLCKGKTFTDIYNRHANTNRNLDILQSVVNQVFSYPSEGTNFDHGDWGDRDEQFGTTILLRKGENGSIIADNVSRYNRVKVGESAVGELWGTEDAYIDGASLKFVLDSANDYLNRSMAPSQEGLLKHMVAVRDNILKTKKAKDFQTGFVRDLATRFDAQFRDTPAWNYGGNQLLPAKAGEADFRRVRSLLPLSVRQKTRELKDAIISLSEKDGDGDMASVLREIPDYDNGTEE